MIFRAYFTLYYVLSKYHSEPYLRLLA